MSCPLKDDSYTAHSSHFIAPPLLSLWQGISALIQQLKVLRVVFAEREVTTRRRSSFAPVSDRIT